MLWDLSSASSPQGQHWASLGRSPSECRVMSILGLTPPRVGIGPRAFAQQLPKDSRCPLSLYDLKVPFPGTSHADLPEVGPSIRSSTSLSQRRKQGSETLGPQPPRQEVERSRPEGCSHFWGPRLPCVPCWGLTGPCAPSL